MGAATCAVSQLDVLYRGVWITSDVEQFLHNIDQNTTDYREDVMTIAEQLRQQGRQKGKQEGIQEGILIGEQRGEQNAAMKIARQLITRGVERTDIIAILAELKFTATRALILFG